jgi:uncharacterized membrane protein YkoI
MKLFSAGATLAIAALAGGIWQSHAHAGAAPPPPSGKVPPWDAMKTAAAKVHGRAINANFEFEDGHWQYGVMVLTGKSIKEVEVNAMTGAAGDVENVDPAKEAREVEQELNAAIAGRR